jgi:myo-inositol-1(or 4)-monophosphatase
MEAAVIASTITNDAEVLAAAVLHDTVEDTAATIEQIESLFGPRVARLVNTETAPKGASWRAKREVQLGRIAAADRDSKIVAIGDNLSNFRAIALDYRTLGDDLWSRFHAPDGKRDIEWYYRGLATSLADLADTAPYQEFVTLIDSVF